MAADCDLQGCHFYARKTKTSVRLAADPTGNLNAKAPAVCFGQPLRGLVSD